VRRGGAPAFGLAAVALAALAALFLRFHAAPPRAGLQFPYDLLYYYVPMAELAAERLARGELPLWNPRACSGIPLLATLQVGVLYPGNWLAFALGPVRGIPALMFLELALGCGFAALFFRSLGAHRAAATAGGILFAATCLLGQAAFWPPQVSTLIWLPWLLFCVERLSRTWRWRFWIGLSLGTALQLLAGFPQLALLGAWLVAPFAALRFGQAARREGSWRLAAGRLAGLAAALALGAGLAGAQLLPTLELVGQSDRGRALAAGEVHYMGAPLSIGGLLRNAVDPAPKLVTFGYGYGTGYLGAATPVFLAIGLALGWRRARSWLWLAVGGLGLLLSQGHTGPFSTLHSWYTGLSWGDLFRSPERFQLLPLFAATALAVEGFDAVARGRERPGARPALAAALAAALAVASAGEPGSAPRALLALALVALGLRTRGGSPGSRIAWGGLLAFLVADLGAATAPYGSLRAIPMGWAREVHLQGQRAMEAPEIARLAAGGGRVALLSLQPMQGSGALARLRRIHCYEPLAPRAWAEVTRRAGVRDPLGAHARGLDPERFATFYDLTSTRRIALPRFTAPVSRGEARIRRRRTQALARKAPGPVPGPPAGVAIEILENADALPRAYLVEAFEVVPGEDAVGRAVRGDFDPHRSVLLERAPAGFASAQEPPPARAAQIRLDRPEEVVVEVEAERGGVLVLTDTFYPGWRARRGGGELEILRANAFYRAVVVPAGRHQIVFRYEPVSLRRGAALSLASLLGLVLVPIGLRARGLRAARAAREEGGGEGRVW